MSAQQARPASAVLRAAAAPAGSRRPGCSRIQWQRRCPARRSDGGVAVAASAAAAGFPADEPAREVVQPDGVIEPDGTTSSSSSSYGSSPPQRTRAELWKAAVKLPMYSVGVVPILVSAAAVFLHTGHANLARTGVLTLGSIAVIAWLNLSNDVFDSMTGVDKTKEESVVTLTGSRVRVFLAAHALLFAGGGLLFSVMSTVADPLVGKMLYTAICMGYLYQGPPFRFSYLGLGEPLCFLAFGPLATCAFYLAQLPTAATAAAATATSLNKAIVALSVLVGMSTTIILFCSHFHQVAGDLAAGKMSPVVRLGTRRAAALLKGAVSAMHIGMLVSGLLGVLPFTVWTSAMVVYGMAGEMVKRAEENPDDPEMLRPLKVYATKWHIAFGAMLCLGMLLQKMM